MTTQNCPCGSEVALNDCCLPLIKGKKTADVRALLGEAAYDEVIHRDNLVIE